MQHPSEQGTALPGRGGHVRTPNPPYPGLTVGFALQGSPWMWMRIGMAWWKRTIPTR